MVWWLLLQVGWADPVAEEADPTHEPVASRTFPPVVFTTACVTAERSPPREKPGAVWFEAFDADQLSKIPGVRVPAPTAFVQPMHRVGGARPMGQPSAAQLVQAPSFLVPRPLATRVDRVLW